MPLRRYSDEVLVDNPVAYWRLGEPNGDSIAIDEKGTYNGTYIGSPLGGVAGALADNTAVTFNGSSQYVRAANGSSLAFPNTTFSVEFWFKASTLAASQFIVAKDGGGVGNGWSVYLNNLGSISTVAKGITGNFAASRLTVATTFGDNVWHHVVTVIKTDTVTTGNNDILAIYIDGISQSLTANTGTTPYVAPTLEVEIGRRSSGNYLTGSVDEVAIYSSALSAARILAHYQAARPPA